MEYLTGTVGEIRDDIQEGCFYVYLETFLGWPLAENEHSTFVFNIPHHPYQAGDKVRVSIEKLNGYSDNRPKTT